MDIDSSVDNCQRYNYSDSTNDNIDYNNDKYTDKAHQTHIKSESDNLSYSNETDNHGNDKSISDQQYIY